jgi:putative nucleotidyltransferase with HDIG domain
MPNRIYNYMLFSEEQRAAKLFLGLFYFINLSYDFIYFYVLPKFLWNEDPGFPEYGLGYYLYIIEFGLIFVADYLFKQKKPQYIKYVYFIVYTLTNITNELIYYLGTNEDYGSGNIAELFLVLFSPIFVNKKFFFLVSIGTILKYAIVGLILQTPYVFIPIVFVLFFSIVAFIVLNRFQGYVRAIEKTYDTQLEGIVKGVIATLELKDPYTKGHSERVAHYSQILAKELGGFTRQELKTFYYACLLHDVGKVNIPDHILMKPSKLTDEEYEIIKMHPVVGAEALKDIDALKKGIDVILYHHERWDGKGYPKQLKGTEIPILARVIAIADAFDAMTSSRSYRSALSPEEAYKRIVESKGSQFDPQLVEVFKKVFPSWVEFLNNQALDSRMVLPEKLKNYKRRGGEKYENSQA